MSTRERILTIRLLEKASGHPVYAALLGIEAMSDVCRQDEKEEPP